MSTGKCTKPPEGFYCWREKNHAGPCAAVPKRWPVPDKHPHRPYDAGYADGYNDAMEACEKLAIESEQKP